MWKPTGLFIMAAMLGAALRVFAQQAAGPDPQAELMAGEIVGVVLYSDGRTPVQDLSVRVWDAEKEKTVFRTRTDKAGIFRIPTVNAGRKYIMVGRATIDLRVLPKESNQVSQHHDIVLVLTRYLLYARTPAIEDVMIGAGGAAMDSLLLRPPAEPPPRPRVVSP